MANIPVIEARSIFTKALIAKYQERIKPLSFLRSFFPSVEEGTKYLSIEVQRGSEFIAADIVRGTEGNRNMFSRSTEKIFEPPYYREFFDATQLDLYDRFFTPGGVVSEDMIVDFVNGVADKLGILQDKIERAYEKQCSEVLETGIVQINSGTNIDYKRKAGSKVDLGGGNYWTTGSVDVFKTIENGGTFLRNVGKSQGGVLNMILGSAAADALLKNTTFTTRQNLFHMQLDFLAPPQRNSVGGTFLGRVTAGTFNVNVWTYPEVYEDSNKVVQPYLNPKNIIILPETTNFKLAFAAVPQLITGGGVANVKGAYKVGEFMDTRLATHEFDIKSAGLAIPVAVDQIYTAQVVA